MMCQISAMERTIFLEPCEPLKSQHPSLFHGYLLVPAWPGLKEMQAGGEGREKSKV